MTIRVFSWLLFSFIVVGLSLILFSLFGFVLEIVHWMRKPQGILSRASAMAARAEAARKPGFWLDVEFPWLTAYLITIPFLVMLWFALEGMSFQPLAFGVLLLPVLVRRWILRQKDRKSVV